MSVLNLNNIKKSYGLNEVLCGFDMDLSQNEITALIGANGSGKTTIFKIIAGLETPDKGTVSVRNDQQIGYLNQVPDLKEEYTLLEELETVFERLIFWEQKLSVLEEKISNIQPGQKEERHNKLMSEYSELQEKFEKEGGYAYQSKIYKVAVGLGFSHRELEKKVSSLSGGEKTRLGLVKLLLKEPDLLLLDEPTNHLDISSIHWLERYLNNYEGTVLIISHDRYFLDQVVERIVELKQGRAEKYSGDYSYYLKERKRRFEQRMKAYQNQQKKIQKLQEAIERLHRWGRQSGDAKLHKRASSMEKRLEKMDKLEKPVLNNDQIALDFNIQKRSGDEVLKVENLTRSFQGEKVLKNLDLQIFWNEKCAVVGDNGTGKTTLLEIITGKLSADGGSYEIGASVKMGYYSQEFNGFDPRADVLTAFRREVPLGKKEARNVLASFHFRGQDVFEKVGNLSGGEKSRLRLLQLMKGNYNFLLLDEPTNHLDLPSREALEEALQNYPGTLLIVSHDRYFLNKIIEYTYELENGHLTRYYGDYDYYHKKKEQRKTEEQDKDGSTGSKESEYHKLKRERNHRQQLKRSIDNIEDEIFTAEERIEELKEDMSDPEKIADPDQLRDMKKEYYKLQDELEDLYDRWDRLTSKIQKLK